METVYRIQTKSQWQESLYKSQTEMDGCTNVMSRALRERFMGLKRGYLVGVEGDALSP